MVIKHIPLHISEKTRLRKAFGIMSDANYSQTQSISQPDDGKGEMGIGKKCNYINVLLILRKDPD